MGILYNQLLYDFLFIIYKIQFWNLKFAKDFIVWFVMAGLPLCFSRAMVKKEYNSFRQATNDGIISRSTLTQKVKNNIFKFEFGEKYIIEIQKY